MKPLARTCIVALTCMATRGANAEAIDRATAREWFAHAKQLGAADAGALWGIELDGPIIFADPVTREVVANQADTEGKLTERDGVWVGSLPDEVAIANFAFTWAGVEWTMLMWPLPEQTYARGRLMMHECYHRIQDELGLPANNPSNNHLDTRDGRIWLQMEWRALSEALIRTGEAKKQAIEDALVFRALRHARFDGAAESERLLEMNEGIAEYTGYRLCGLPNHVLPDRVSIRLIDSQGTAGFVRNFAYVSGPAYGLLLDAFDPFWRANLAASSDLGALLRDAVEFKIPSQLERDASARVHRYDGERLIARETERDRQRQERLGSYRTRFIDGPVLRLSLSENVSYSYNPNGLEAIDDAQTVYNSLRVVDEWGILEVTGGALIERKGNHVDNVRVPTPDDVTTMPIEGDGWTLRLNDGWKLVPGTRAGDYTVSR